MNVERMKFNTVNIHKALKSKKRFNIFDIDYTDEEKECLINFKIKKFEDYEHYGTIKLNKLKLFLENIGDNNLKQVNILKNIIKKISKILISSHETKYFAIRIRISLNPDVSVPRWHMDGPFFERNNETHFLTTLKGPSTYLTDDKKYIKIYNKIYKKQSDEQFKLNSNNIIKNMKIHDKYDKIYRKELKGTKIIQPSNYQGIILNIGDKKTAAVHSEPAYNEPRIFISILTGTKKEVKDLEIRLTKSIIE
jgi:hypothetical protein